MCFTAYFLFNPHSYAARNNGILSNYISVFNKIKSTSSSSNTSASSSTYFSIFDNSRPVVIDAGHGGKDPGTSGNGLVEKDITLDIALKLNEILQNEGVNTYMIRTDDTNMDRKDRIYKANKINAALYLSIHCDWYKSSSIKGMTIYRHPSEDIKYGNLSSKKYAENIHKELLKATDISDRGIKNNTEYAVLRHAKMPSVLVELGYLSNPYDASVLGSQESREAIARSLADGIINSLQDADEVKK